MIATVPRHLQSSMRPLVAITSRRLVAETGQFRHTEFYSSAAKCHKSYHPASLVWLESVKCCGSAVYLGVPNVGHTVVVVGPRVLGFTSAAGSLPL